VLLEDKNAVISGGGGKVGGAIARDFAREGAMLFLTGRTLESLEEVAAEIAPSNKQSRWGQQEENL
jgi:3-oxoacyl-[acyl-carrier protein] reductase